MPVPAPDESAHEAGLISAFLGGVDIIPESTTRLVVISYKHSNPQFTALAANTLNLRRVLSTMRERGLKALVATGSVFEPDEGVGPAPRRAFSPAQLSRTGAV